MTNIISLGKLQSAIVEDHDAEETEGGFFEQEITVPEHEFMMSKDRRGLVNVKIGTVLVNCVQHTKLSKEYWVYLPSDFARKHFNFPAEVKMG